MENKKQQNSPRALNSMPMNILRVFFLFCVLQVGVGMPVTARAESSVEEFITFIEAVRMGDRATVEQSLQQGMDINRANDVQTSKSVNQNGVVVDELVQDINRFNALFHALDARQWEMARFLMARGANISAESGGHPPFYWAAVGGNAELVNEIWQRLPAAERTKIMASRDVIEQSMVRAHLDVVKSLVKLGFDLRGEDEGGSLLQCAVASGHVECVNYLLKNGISPDARRYDGKLVLCKAALSGDLAMMKALLAGGASVDGVSEHLDTTVWRSTYRNTALVSAVIGSEPEAVALLLKNGADPRLLDNLAIKWADLLGDKSSFEQLRRAGAPDPGEYAFRAWLPKSVPLGKIQKEPFARTVIPSLLMESDGDGPAAAATLSRETKFAIINLDSGLDEAEALLTARLSRVDGLTLLERNEVRRITKERRLTADFGRQPAEVAKLGKLLGADALVCLQLKKYGEQAILDVRIVSVSTGLITSRMPGTWDPKALERWSDRVAGRCVADGAKIFIAPKDARLVSVTPFTASLNTSASRALEQQLTLLTSYQLSRLPGVYVLERSEMDRLLVEGGGEIQALLAGSGLLAGSVDLAGGQKGRVLVRITLTSIGGKAAERVISVEGDGGDPLDLARRAVAEIAKIIALPSDSIAQAPADEAALYQKQAEAFAKRLMWTEAQAAAEAAWALGGRSDGLLRLRGESAISRALFSAKVFPKIHREGAALEDADSLLSYRAPLIFAPMDERELRFIDYLDLSGRMLDVFEMTLDRSGDQFGDGRYDEWLAGPIWAAATLPLRFGEALSYSRDYGTELHDLRLRLLALNDRALAKVKSAGWMTAYHTLLALRAKQLAFWTEDDATFQSELRKILQDAHAAPPPMSEHVVWTTVYQIGLESMNTIAGNRAQEWLRLARKLAASDDPRERYLGRAWLVKEYSYQSDALHKLLRDDFEALVKSDRALGGSYWREPVAKDSYPGREAAGVAAWYSEIPSGGGSWHPTYVGPWIQRVRIIPESRAFWLRCFFAKIDTIMQSGPSCLFVPSQIRNGYSIDELTQVVGALRRIEPILTAATKQYPSAKVYGMDAMGSIESITKDVNEEVKRRATGNAPILRFTNPKVLFSAERLSPSAAGEERAYNRLGNGTTMRGNLWFLARTNTAQKMRSYRVFKIGSDGEPEGLLEFKTDLFYGKFDHRGLSLDFADVTEDYFVSSVSSSDKPSIFVYDRKRNTCSFIETSIPFGLVYDVHISGNKLYICYLYNATVAAFKGQPDLLKTGDPVWGVIEHDLVNGGSNLLVSSRRNPAVSPIDGATRLYEEFARISDTVFSIQGFNQWAYDSVAGSWIEMTDEKRKQIRNAGTSANRPVKPKPAWDVYCYINKPGIATFNRIYSKKRVDLRITVEDGELLGRLPEGSAIRERYLKAKSEMSKPESGIANDRRVYVTGYGILLWVGPVYYWMPAEEFRGIIDKTLVPK